MKDGVCYLLVLSTTVRQYFTGFHMCIVCFSSLELKSQKFGIVLFSALAVSLVFRRTSGV